MEVLHWRAAPSVGYNNQNSVAWDVEERAAINQLINLPEVQAVIRAMRMTHRDLGDPSTGRKGQKFSISLQGVTMREALNRVAKESGARFWIFRRDRNGIFSISNSPR